MKLFAVLVASSVMLSAIIKYVMPEWIDLETLLPIRMQAIAICAVTLPVAFFAILVWQQSAD